MAVDVRDIFRDNKPLFLHSESTFRCLERLIRRFNPSNAKDIMISSLGSLVGVSKTYDLLVGIEILERVSNPRAVLKLMHSALVDNGIVLLTATNNQNWISRLYYLVTGKFPVFSEHNTTGRVLPSFAWQIPLLSKGLFRIEEVTYNRSVIPFLRIQIPFKSLLFGENIVFVLRKI